MAVALRDSGVAVADPEFIACTGWTTDDLSCAIHAAGSAARFELVSLQIGVNNQFRGRMAEEYDPQFRQVLRQAVECAGGIASRLIVLSIPDWGATPYAAGRDRYRIAVEIDAFNAVNRVCALAAGARYVDITPSSRESATDRSLLADDGLHPSATMYATWAKLALPEAARALAAHRR
jgi:lysophospholipase L1-like esterase